jgi:hypothetical protein
VDSRAPWCPRPTWTTWSPAFTDNTNSTEWFPAEHEDGACYYVGSDHNVYFLSVGGGDSEYGGLVNLSSGHTGAAVNVVTGHGSGLYDVAGNYDGTYVRVFWVGSDGNIWEAYALASSISNSSTGTWYVQEIYSGGTAAH